MPLGQVKSRFNYNVDLKRVLNFENVVDDSDNVKQDMSIDVYGRKDKDEEPNQKAAAPAAQVSCKCKCVQSALLPMRSFPSGNPHSRQACLADLPGLSNLMMLHQMGLHMLLGRIMTAEDAF